MLPFQPPEVQTRSSVIEPVAPVAIFCFSGNKFCCIVVCSKFGSLLCHCGCYICFTFLGSISKEAAGVTEINSVPAMSPVQVTLYVPDFVSPDRVIFLGIVTVKVEPTFGIGQMFRAVSFAEIFCVSFTVSVAVRVRQRLAKHILLP